MSVIRVEEAAVMSAANRCTQLQAKLEECSAELISLNNELQGVTDGQTAASFDGYVQSQGAPALRNCAEMLGSTGQALIRVCQQFTEADRALSGTFNV